MNLAFCSQIKDQAGRTGFGSFSRDSYRCQLFSRSKCARTTVRKYLQCGHPWREFPQQHLRQCAFKARDWKIYAYFAGHHIQTARNIHADATPSGYDARDTVNTLKSLTIDLCRCCSNGRVRSLRTPSCCTHSLMCMGTNIWLNERFRFQENRMHVYLRSGSVGGYVRIWISASRLACEEGDDEVLQPTRGTHVLNV